MNKRMFTALILISLGLSLFGIPPGKIVKANYGFIHRINTFCDTGDSSLIGCWQLEEGSGSSIIDGSSYGNNGTTSGSPTWVSGRDGLSLILNGSSQYALVPDSNSLDIGTNRITLSAWILPTRAGDATQNVIKKTIGTTTANGYELSLASNGKVFVRFNGNSLYRVDSATDYPHNGSAWMHIAATYDGTTIRLYINGVSENPKTATFTIAANSTSLGIGAEPAASPINFFQGQIDDLRIYNRTLSAEEIQGLAGGVDLSIIKTDNKVYALPGESSIYSIVVANPSTITTVSGVTVTDNFPTQLTGISWTCSAGGGSTCTASGTGNINDSVVLAPGGSVTYTVNATISPSASGVINNTATITPPAGITDPNSSNNSAIDTTAIRSGGALCGNDSDLVICYQLDEGSGNIFLDGIQNAVYNDGTLFNSPAWTTGTSGHALSFNGTSQYGFTPDENSLDIENQMTIAAWLKPGNNTTQSVITKSTNGGIGGYELSLSSSTAPVSQRIFFRINQVPNGDTYRVNSSTTYPTNGTWVHAAGTFDGTTMRIYINGVLEASVPANGVLINTNTLPLSFGAQFDGSSALRWYTGDLDDVRIYNRALSAEEIGDLFNPTPVKLADLKVNSTPKGIQLTWQTVQEADLIGFNIFRSETIDGNQVKINNELIPALTPGQIKGNQYQFVDVTAEKNKVYFYWIEWVGKDNLERFGPVTCNLVPFVVWLPMGLK